MVIHRRLSPLGWRLTCTVTIAPVGKLLNFTVARKPRWRRVAIRLTGTGSNLSFKIRSLAGNTERDAFAITSLGNNIIELVTSMAFLGGTASSESIIVGVDPMLLASGRQWRPNANRCLLARQSGLLMPATTPPVGLPSTDQRGAGFARAASGDHVDIKALEAQVVQPTISIDRRHS